VIPNFARPWGKSKKEKSLGKLKKMVADFVEVPERLISDFLGVYG